MPTNLNSTSDNDPLREIADPLKRLFAAMAVIIEFVREVAEEADSWGMYLYGRGGTGKSMLVEQTLDDLGVNWECVMGYLPHGGLRDFIADCVNRGIEIIVFDDCGPLVADKKNLSLLLALMTGKSFRYQRQGQPPQMIAPPKGMIFISNESLPEGKMVSAVKTRGRIRDYEPENPCLEAWALEWAKGNGGPPRTGLTISETTEAIEFLITQTRKREAALDLRLIAKTYRSFRRWKDKKTDIHWHVLVISEIEQSIIGATAKQSQKLETAKERLKRERSIVREILKIEPECRKKQIKLWLEISPDYTERSFDRRKRDVKNGIE